MSYNKPIDRPAPLDELCGYGCGGPAVHWMKRRKRWCCSDHVGKCPAQKEKTKLANQKRKILKSKYPDINLDYVRAIYPYAAAADIPDGTLRYNDETQKVEARCTYFECEQEWFDIDMGVIHYRDWALTPVDLNDPNGPTQGGDGYKYYCSQECRDLCSAHGKSGAMIYREIVMAHMIDWEDEEEWYGVQDVPQSEKNLWRETCLIRDGFLCIRCSEPAVHVHHEHPCKTHPMEYLDPDNGLSVCLRCHYDHFHKRGSLCSLPNLAKKVCFSIVNGMPMRPVEKIQSPPQGVLTI